MKKILQILFEHKTLDKATAKEVLVNIGKGVYNEHEVTAFMTVYLMRSITIEELQGFREALLELCVPVDLNGYDVIDIVGTGGDGKNTFNISTLSCFVVAGAGQKVAKHGNYGASSISGASNVMEQVGYKFKNQNEKLKREVDEANICFLHAPLFHPALKTVGPIRKNLGMRTFFNMSDVKTYLQKLDQLKLKNPVLVGFGIKDKQTFNAACEHARGAIIGTAFIKALEQGDNIEHATKEFLSTVISQDAIKNY